MKYNLLCCLFFCTTLLTAQIPPSLVNKWAFKGEYPITASFRGAPTTQSATQSAYTNEVLRAITHVPDVTDLQWFSYPDNLAYANAMAATYPDKLFLQVMQAGSGMPRSLPNWSPNVDRLARLPLSFQGHWACKPRATLTNSISATDNTLTVDNSANFVIESYDAPYVNGCPALIVEKLGSVINWNHWEYVYVTAKTGNNLTINRQFRDSDPASAFNSANAYVVPIIPERTWGEPDVWYINMSSNCPTDANGKKATDILLDDLATRFDASSGTLNNFSGVDYASGPFKNSPSGADMNWDGVTDAETEYQTNVKSFLSQIETRFGSAFLKFAGSNDPTYLSNYNGVNSEGLIAPADPYHGISDAVNARTFWQKYSKKPNLSVEVLRIQEVDKLGAAGQPIWLRLNRMGVGYATCFGTCASIRSKVFVANPAENEDGVVKLSWTELFKGTQDVEHWLGKPTSEAMRVAERATNILGNSKTDWVNIQNKITTQNISMTINGSNQLVLTPTIGRPNHKMTITMPLTQIQNLTFLFDIKSGSTSLINNVFTINSAKLSVVADGASDSESTNYSNTEFMTRGFYWRSLPSGTTSCTVTLNFEGDDPIIISGMGGYEVPDAMARSFEHGVVLVNPALTDMTFNLTSLFGTGFQYQRLQSPTVTVPSSWATQQAETMAQNNGSVISTPSNVVVSYLNALFLSSSGIVPVDLVQFDVKKQGNDNVLIHWQTANEYNIANYELERSNNGIDFTTIYRKDIYKNTSQLVDYQHLDEKLEQGVYYYRLKTNDVDKHFQYSKIVTVTINNVHKITLYPNPTTGFLNIETTDYQQPFELINAFGQVILQGKTLTKTLDLKALTSGVYYLKVLEMSYKIVKE